MSRCTENVDFDLASSFWRGILRRLGPIAPKGIVFHVLFCRFCYKLSFRNLAELFLLRGFEFIHRAVQEWETRFARLPVKPLRRRRLGTRTGRAQNGREDDIVRV
jgi:hypothetical protein